MRIPNPRPSRRNYERVLPEGIIDPFVGSGLVISNRRTQNDFRRYGRSLQEHDHYKSTTFCFYDPAAVGQEYRFLARSTTAEAYREVLEPLKGDCKIVFEVGIQTQWVAKIIRDLGLEVKVVNAGRIPWLFRSKRKNDRLEAKKLATLLHMDQLPTVYLPPADVSAWRALINHRRGLVKRSTMIKNQVRSIVRAFSYRCPHRSCWTRVGQVWLRSLNFDEARHLMLLALLDGLRSTNDTIRVVERKLDEIARSHPNGSLLQSIPGVGPRTAEAIVAFADRVDRFTSRKQFAGYFGMAPGQDSFGGGDHHLHITKQGPSVVRWVLVEAVHQVVRRSPEFRSFFERVCHGRKDKSKKAIVATGRKLLTIAFAMMRDQTAFNGPKVLQSVA